MVFGFLRPSRVKKFVRLGANAGTFAVVAMAASLAFAQTNPLNDTGLTFCGGARSGNNNPCLGTEPAGQDIHFGRDAAALAGTLPVKMGGSGGNNGFDFTKIANNGNALSPTATLDTGPTDWACTRDNVTNLIWEVKTTSGLRDQARTYSWYMTGSPDGNNGTANGGQCAVAGRCDTEKFVADVNAAGLCGALCWRIAPTSGSSNPTSSDDVATTMPALASTPTSCELVLDTRSRLPTARA